MSYTYLQEQGEESSAVTFSDIPPSVLSRLNLTAERFSSSVNETEYFQDSQSGMMSQPLTEGPGEGRSMSFVGDSLAKTSVAPGGGAGLNGERSGLWSEMARIIGEVRPRFAFVENSPMLTLRGLNRVLGDLTEMGHDARWGVVSASNTGAPHRRERIWIFANSKGSYVEKQKVVGAALQKRAKGKFGGASSFHAQTISAPSWYGNQPGMVGLDDGFSKYVDRAKAAGNAQVPIVAATAWRILTA
jgi:hypothetical protein